MINTLKADESIIFDFLSLVVKSRVSSIFNAHKS